MAENRSAAQRLALARHPQRPGAREIIGALFPEFFELRGDRCCGEDEAILGGVALFHGRPVTVIGTRKGRTLTENLRMNFGMPSPEGYRKALRLMKQAEKFGRPIITLIDTAGAYPGMSAEEHGQGEAIARSLFEMSRLRVPVIAVITGEGNSGGALALAVANRLNGDHPLSFYRFFKNIGCQYIQVTPVVERLAHHDDGRQLASLVDEGQLAPFSIRPKQWGNFHKYAPGSKYEYSNFGAGIMGSLMEAVTGMNLNDSVTASLFDPLGIDAGYHQTLVDVPENITALYSADRTVRRTRSLLLSQTWDNSVNPDKHYRITMGAVWIKGRDLCRIGMLLCQGGTLDGVTILQPETVSLMMADQNGRPGITCSSPYGLCINRVSNLVKGRMIYGHQGMANGIVCNVYFDPETQFVFALVTNGSSDNMNDRICKVSRKTFNLCWQAFSGTEDTVIY